jgi:hypothetical protein
MPTVSSLTFKPAFVKQIHNAFFFNLGLGCLAVAGLSCLPCEALSLMAK